MKLCRRVNWILLIIGFVLLLSTCDFLQNQGGGSATSFVMNKLTMNVQGKGSIVAQPAPLSDGTYPKGTTVQLNASGDLRNGFWRFVISLMFSYTGAIDPLNMSKFIQWTGDINTSANPTTLQITKETQVQAVFSRVGVTTFTTANGRTDNNAPPPYAVITYDANGRPTRADFFLANQTTEYQYATFMYNSAGQCVVVYCKDYLTNAFLWITNYTYTASGDYSKITMQNVPSGYTFTFTYGYDSLGRISAWNMTQTSSGNPYGQDMYCSYDDRGILQQLDVYINGTYSYYLCTHDSNGNITQMQGYDQNGLPMGGMNQTITITYDANGFLSQLSMPNGSYPYTVTLGW
jgi:hypothetical protein